MVGFPTLVRSIVIVSAVFFPRCPCMMSFFKPRYRHSGRTVICQLLLCLLLFFLYRESKAEAVNESLALQVSENFLRHINATHTIDQTTPVQSSGNNVGYLVTLKPHGYILVASDDTRVPIKGYSLTTTYSNLPESYRAGLLQELELETPQLQMMAASTIEEINKPYWDFLKNDPPLSATALSYTPDTSILTTTWGQGYPYNRLTPLDGTEHTLTGCVQTATAQMLRYHAHPAFGNGAFTQSWNGQALATSMNRPFNWQLMPDSPSATTQEYQLDEVAALMRDIGIMYNASWGTSATSTAFNYSRFETAFQYAPVEIMHQSDPDFFTTIRDEINNERPVFLSLPGHLTVADGYSSDPSGKSIHVNMGWEGAYDDFYFLDQTIITGSLVFPSGSHTIYYNIRPCVGLECTTPYAPLGTNAAPVIVSSLGDIAINGEKKIRIDGYDPDGDNITYQVQSACPDLTATVNGNILTLTPEHTDKYCRVTVTAESHDGSTVKKFNVLTVAAGTNLGNEYDLFGQFADQNEVDTYTVYLNGATTISGNRGYSNQAFFIWVTDLNSNPVIASTDDPISADFTGGYYLLKASLKNASGTYYPYDANYSEYILSLSTNVSINQMATDLGLVPMDGDIDNNGEIDLADAILSLQVMIGMADTPGQVYKEADVNGDLAIGLAEAIFCLMSTAGEF